MSKFGWSYPPGCRGTPHDESDPPCAICLGDPASCGCPECPVCLVAGDPDCYGPEGHGLEETWEQVFDYTYRQRLWEEEATREAVWGP